MLKFNLESNLIIFVIISSDGVPVLKLHTFNFRSGTADVSQPFDPAIKEKKSELIFMIKQQFKNFSSFHSQQLFSTIFIN